MTCSKLLPMLLLTALLAGCSNFSLDGLASAGTASVATAGVTALTGSPIAGVVVGGATGVATDGLIPDFKDAAQDFCSANPDDCDRYLLIQAFEKIWMWLVFGILGLITIAWLLPGPQSLFFWRRK